MNSPDFYQAILDLFPGWVAVISRDHRVLYVNQKMREWCGEDPSGKLCYQVFHGLSQPCPWCKKEEVLEQRKPAFWELRSSKDSRWFEIRSLPLPWQEKMLYLTIILDITEKKRLEEKLEKQLAFFRKVLDESPILILFNRQRKPIFVNRTFERITGIPRTEALGRNLFELIVPPEALSEWQRHCDEVHCGIFKRGVELPLLDRQGGLHYLLWNCMQVEDPEGEPLVVGMAVDITENKRLQEEYLQIQKMESLGRFTGVLLHELNNLFMALQGYISVSRLKLDQPEKVRQNLDRMEELIDRWRHMSRDLLSFTKKSPIQAEVVDLAQALRRVEETLQRLLGSGIQVVVEAPKGGLPVRLNPAALQQILFNLASNAREAMGGRGKIQITLEKVELPEESAQILELSSGPYALLTFRDTGPGIPSEVLPHIFEPYFTTKAEGTGLGLATVYSLVKQHRGHIAAYNHPEGGAVFRIYLPLVTSSPGKVSRDLSLLVVEENQVLLETLKDLLEYLEYQPRLARSFREVRDLLEQGFVPKILLTDIYLRSGPQEREILELAARFPEMKLIIATPYPWEMVEKALSGLKKRLIYLSKPFSLDDLRQALEKACELT